MASQVEDRWAGAVTDGRTGFTAVPDILIRSQSELGISAVGMVVLLNLLLHWWDNDGDWPYPRISTIARRMGTSRRTVERAVVDLESKGLLKRTAGLEDNDGISIRRFDLSGLVSALSIRAATLRGEHAEGVTGERVPR